MTRWVVAAAAVAVAAAAGAGDNATNVRRMAAALDWLERGGDVPAHWTVTRAADLADLRTLGHAGAVKEVWASTVRGADVVVKSVSRRSVATRTRGDGADPAPDRVVASAAFPELAFLEYCRGLPGVPALLGGFRDERGRAAWVVADAGDPIGTGSGRADRPTRTYAAYDATARLAPLALARAIFRCFHSFAEVGGFFLGDFKPAQFTLAPDGAIALVDGPLFLDGAAADYVRREFRAELGHHAVPRRRCAPGARRRDDRCAERLVRNGWCTKPRNGWGGWCETNSSAAPEAAGVCLGAPAGAVRGHGVMARCAPLTAKTHVFDVAAKRWLLPRIIELAADRRAAARLRSLRDAMVDPDPAARPAFAALVDALA